MLRIWPLFLLLAAPAVAQVAAHPAETPVSCPAKPVLPPELAGWTAMTPVTAASDVQRLAGALLTLGKSALATLPPAARLSFPVAPGHAASAGSHAGLFAFAVTEAATYRVALSGPAWVDVVANGRTLPSSAHGHGGACSGIAKTVDFTLQPGRYILQLSSVATPSITAMVTRVPAAA